MGRADDAERHARLSELVGRALPLPAAEREALLDSVRADDPELCGEVEALLAQADTSDGPLRGLAPGEAMRAVLEPPTEGDHDAVSPHPDSPPDEDDPDADPKTRLGPYRLEEKLGSGGMGVVWRAWDERLDRPVAVKTISTALSSNTQMRTSFVREARLLARLQHPHVATVHDLPQVEGPPVLVMELLGGEDLSTRLARGPLDLDTTLRLGRQVASALDLAHRHGIVHRDLKPANIRLLENGDVKVLDFGLAREIKTDVTGSTGHGRVVGTPGYLSPEQARGETLDGRSDLFALGAVLHECLSGQRCFPGELTDSLRRTLHEPPDTSVLPSDLPEELRRLLRRCLDKSVTSRIASAGAVLETLNSLARELGEAAVVSSEPGRSLPGRPACAVPVEPDEFVGRETELTELRQHFSGGARLVSVLGPGGMGKTRLAQHHARRDLELHPGGAWFCDLSETTSREEILHAVAKALQVPLKGGEPVELLGHALAGRGRCLLILDNFEQVVEHAEATLGPWLTRAPEARFLVTSRERLRLVGEKALTLAPLPAASDGQELFVLRARAHGRELGTSEDDRTDVEELVTLLDGLPLAIELAAARSRMLSPRQLRERLADRFALLAGRREATGRQATLRATIDWSWKLLEPWERTALAQCAVFEGGFTLEAAEAVLDLSPFPDAPWPLDVVQLLLDQSLLHAWIPVDRGGRRQSGETCFGLYASIREHAAEKLHDPNALGGAAGPELTLATEERHGRYFARFETDEKLATLETSDGEKARSSLELQLPDLLAACRRAVDRDDDDVAVSTLATLGHLLSLTGPTTTVVELGRRVLSSVTTSPSRRSRAHQVLATALDDTGALDEASTHHESALTLARQEADRRLEARALERLARHHQRRSEVDESARRYAEALALAESLDDRWLAMGVRLSRGTLWSNRGELAAAETDYLAALSSARELGNRRREGGLLVNLATLSLELGRLEEARERVETALPLLRQVGDRRVEGSARGNLGILLGELGRTDDARSEFETALRIHRELGNRRSEGLVLAELGALDFGRGQWTEARSRFEEALSLHRELGNRRSESLVHGHLANLAMAQGQLDEAQRSYERALTLHRQVEDQRHEGTTLAQLGLLMLRKGQVEEGLASFSEGAALLKRHDYAPELARLLVSRCEEALDIGETSLARESWTEASAILTELDLGEGSPLGKRLAELEASLEG
ncbi:MAG: protein kinase [Acidobacteriota bacterium]